MAQFTCGVCGNGFDEEPAFERHMATSHQEQAPTAADVQTALGGVQFPKTREELISYAFQEVPDKSLLDLINTLPSRTYRDSAEVAIALGEVKQRRGKRAAGEVAKTE